ncbi:MAG: hypothetical protein ABH986_02655 [archaeon]
MKAQASLELILLMSVFFSVMLLFTPVISKTFFLGIYALDALKAKDFSDSFSAASAELNSMSTESSLSITAEPLLEWRVKADSNSLEATVLLEKYGKKKTFFSGQFNLVPFEHSFSEKTVFVLTKTEQGILTEIQQV